MWTYCCVQVNVQARSGSSSLQRLQSNIFQADTSIKKLAHVLFLSHLLLLISRVEAGQYLRPEELEPGCYGRGVLSNGRNKAGEASG